MFSNSGLRCQALCDHPYQAQCSLRGRDVASDVTPKFVSPSDPAAQWTGALRNAAFFAYANNYLIDVKFGIIMDVEASRAIRQAEVSASQTMIERTEACFGIRPKWLAADSAYGSASNLDWLVNEQGIAPHVPVIDKSQRENGTFSREDFSYDESFATEEFMDKLVLGVATLALSAGAASAQAVYPGYGLGGNKHRGGRM